MKKIKNKAELLAPAGSLEKMKMAFAFGADAVYLGVPSFSLRQRINYFDLPKIKKAVDYARLLDKKVYITLNIFARDRHFRKLDSYVKKLKKINPDGLFISDPGVLAVVKKIWPKANLVLSTQANCTNSESARFWQSQGMRRVILARELSFQEVRQIKKECPDLEVEVFVHGALCMAWSGRCFLSKFYNDRSANLGDCSQPCRWPFEEKNLLLETKNHQGKDLELTEDENGSYIFNSKDLCLIERLPEILNANIDALKIEGRAKSVYYLANVVGAYRRALDFIGREKDSQKIKKELKFLKKELEEKLYHRGYTEGFMFGEGEQAQNSDNSHKYPEWEFCGEVAAKKKLEEEKFPGLTKVKVHNSLKTGDDLEIVKPPFEVEKIKLKEMIDSESEEKINAVHGGSGKFVFIKTKKPTPEFSVIRAKRSLNKK